MKRNKTDGAKALLDAMNEIDDVYLDEALQALAAPPKARRLPFYRRPVTKIAAGVAALAAVLAIVFTGAIGHLFGVGRNDMEEAAPGMAESAPENTFLALNNLLQDCTQSEDFTVTAAEDLKLFDGTIRLTVRNDESGRLYVSRPLTPAEQEQLLVEWKAADSALGSLSGGDKKPAESLSPESSDGRPAETETYSVWVTLGDGQVITPCLSPSGGNIGAGVLFDYEAERLPTNAFFDLLKAML